MKIFKKMLAFLLFAGLLTALLSGCAAGTRASQAEDVHLDGDTKVLVVYFSWSGHLDSMAHWVADETGGDIVRVLAKEEYPADYDDTADRAKQEKDDGVRPEITLDLSAIDLSKYDTVFFGYPV